MITLVAQGEAWLVPTLVVRETVQGTVVCELCLGDH